MAGIDIDPKDLAIPTQPPTGGGGGVVIDPSMVAQPVQTPARTQIPPGFKEPSGFMQGLGDIPYAAGQLVGKALEQVPENVTFMGRPVAASARAFSEKVVPQREEVYQAGRVIAAEKAGLPTDKLGTDFARMGGNIVGGLIPGLGVARGVSAIAPAGTIAGSALTGGISSGLMTPVEKPGDFGAQKAQQVMLGAALGPVIDKTVGAVVSPAVTAGAQKMRELGVNLTPGQMFGGVTQGVENLMAKFPVLGAGARSAQERSLQDFNTGVINKALSNIGETLPKDKTGRDAIQYMYKKVDDAYENVLPKVSLGNTMGLYQGIGDTLQNFQTTNDAHRKFLNEFVQNKIVNPLSKADLTGREFKNIDTELNRMVNNYKTGNGDEKMLADALKNLQGTLRGELRAINPKDAPALDAANAAFADKVRIERAAGALGSDQGVFTPAQFEAAVKATDATARRSAFARGEARMQDIADAAKATMGRTGPVAPTLGGQEFAGIGGLGTAAYAGYLDQTLAGLATLGGYGAANLGYSRPAMSAYNALMLSARPKGASLLREALPGSVAPATTGLLRRDEPLRIDLNNMLPGRP